MRKEDYLISLIVPVYNEKETIELFVSTVEQKLASIWQHIEIVFVDDGSKDNSAQIVEDLIAKGKPISLIKLSRNFGKEAAMSAPHLSLSKVMQLSRWTLIFRTLPSLFLIL